MEFAQIESFVVEQIGDNLLSFPLMVLAWQCARLRQAQDRLAADVAAGKLPNVCCVRELQKFDYKLWEERNDEGERPILCDAVDAVLETLDDWIADGGLVRAVAAHRAAGRGARD